MLQNARKKPDGRTMVRMLTIAALGALVLNLGGTAFACCKSGGNSIRPVSDAGVQNAPHSHMRAKRGFKYAKH
jgi:hypothetical protein